MNRKRIVLGIGAIAAILALCMTAFAALHVAVLPSKLSGRFFVSRANCPDLVPQRSEFAHILRNCYSRLFCFQ